jgi:hypothetical protein
VIYRVGHLHKLGGSEKSAFPEDNELGLQFRRGTARCVQVLDKLPWIVPRSTFCDVRPDRHRCPAHLSAVSYLVRERQLLNQVVGCDTYVYGAAPYAKVSVIADCHSS